MGYSCMADAWLSIKVFFAEAATRMGIIGFVDLRVQQIYELAPYVYQ